MRFDSKYYRPYQPRMMPVSTIKTVLLTLGRLPVALDIARAFDAAGWRVIVADPWAMHLLRMSKSVSKSLVVPSPRADVSGYCDELARIVSDESVELVIPVSEETVYVAALRDRGLPVFCMSQDKTLGLHDKARFIRLAETIGLPVPRTALASESPDFTASTSYVSKPRFSCSGRGIRFHAAGSLCDTDDQLVVQEKLEGEHQSIFCVSRDGELPAWAVYRPTLIDGSVSIAFESVLDSTAVVDWARRFARATAHTGFISFDFIVGEDGRALPIECNPRATSGIHFLTGEVLVEAIIGDRDRAQDQALREQRLKESYSCFTRLLRSVSSRNEFRCAAKAMRESTDVTWQRSDPWPFLLMTINSWRIIIKAMSAEHSFASASVADVEGRPEDAP